MTKVGSGKSNDWKNKVQDNTKRTVVRKEYIRGSDSNIVKYVIKIRSYTTWQA